MTMGRPRKIVSTPDVLTDGEVVIVEPLDEEEMDMLEDEAPLDGEVVEEVPMSESTRLEMQAGAEAVRRNQAMAALAAAQAEEAKG
jgi:predicted thioredoxin/glutaredoxin